MKLHYRGASYESNSQVVETVETGTTATFRGRTYPVRHQKAGSYSQPQMNLKYRGSAYTVNSTSTSKPQVSSKDDRKIDAIATALRA